MGARHRCSAIVGHPNTRSQKAPSLGSGSKGVGQRTTSSAKNRNPTAIDLSKGGRLLALKAEVLGRSQLQAWPDPWTSAVMSETYPFLSLCSASLFQFGSQAGSPPPPVVEECPPSPKTGVCQGSHPRGRGKSPSCYLERQVQG